MKKTLVILGMVFLSAWLLNSCIKDNFDFDKWDGEVNWNPEFIAPALWCDLSIAEAIVAYDTTIQLIENEQGFISLKYNTHVSSRKISEVIYLPDQEFNGLIHSMLIDFSGFNQTGDVLSGSLPGLMSFTMFNNEAEIDTVLLKAGVLNSVVQSTFKHTLQLEFVFPTITKDGQALKLTFFFPPTGGYQATSNVDVTGYKADMTQTTQGYNEVPVEINYTFYHSGSADNSGMILFDSDFTGLNYSWMTGYFGYNSLIFESDTLDINIFKNENFNVDEYYFQDPKFKVFYKNSYGIPTNFYFTEMFAQSKINGQNYSIIDYENGLPLDSLHPYNVSFPYLFGTVREDSIILHRNNSNIPQVISIQPKWIQFIAHAHTNPYSTSHNNFVSDQSSLDAEVVVELPLWGYIDNFHARDTAEFDFDDIYGTAKIIKRLAVRLDMHNGFPVEGHGQIYFLDENYMVLDSLLQSVQDRIIPAATVDANGRVIDFADKLTIIEMTDDKIEMIKNTKYIIYEGHTNSSEYTSHKLVKVYGDYRMKFDVSFELDLGVNVDIDTLNN
ncbi:MAG TPA: hypothetical protein PLZ52_03700 [Bacteroidales bacterium]|nr:hypothetical protein [Bacteroidales bacterium]HQL69647.1 hypothetical protein [Bacteroidales bacterium]